MKAVLKWLAKHWRIVVWAVLFVGLLIFIASPTLRQWVFPASPTAPAPAPPTTAEEEPAEAEPAEEESAEAEPAEAEPAAPAPAEPKVTTSVLLQELAHPDAKGVAIDAAHRLIRRPEAVEEIVLCFVSGNPEMKKRTRFCLCWMGEPARLWMVDVLSNPDDFPPTVVAAIKELIGSLPAPESAKPTPDPPKTTVEAEVKELTAALEKMRAEFTTVQNAWARAKAENKRFLSGQLDEMRREIGQLKEAIKASEAARATAPKRPVANADCPPGYIRRWPW